MDDQLGYLNLTTHSANFLADPIDMKVRRIQPAVCSGFFCCANLSLLVATMHPDENQRLLGVPV